MPNVQRTATSLALAALLGAASLAHAQAAKPAASPAPAAIDAEKQKLIDQVIAIWHPERNVVVAAVQPADQMLAQANVALQQKALAQPKIEATMKDIKADAQKYADTVSPLVMGSAKKHMSTTVVPLLAQGLSTDELKQLLAWLQSPVRLKFEKVLPQADQALARKVSEEIGPQINKDVQALGQTVGTKVRAAVGAPAESK